MTVWSKPCLGISDVALNEYKIVVFELHHIL